MQEDLLLLLNDNGLHSNGWQQQRAVIDYLLEIFEVASIACEVVYYSLYSNGEGKEQVVGRGKM